jgi:phosphohistidine phosphatase
MSRQLILMRHAKSAWDNPGVTDHDRTLNKRGRTAAPLMAEHLREHALIPDLIMASTAVRVRETIALLTETWGAEPTIQYESSLYLASRETLLAYVRGLHDAWNKVMFVGHNPGLSELAGWLGQSSLDLPTAAVAVFKYEKPMWRDASTDQAWDQTALWLPRELAD